MAPSQEDEWKLMINQDSCLGSITGDSGHGTMTITRKTESTEEVEQLIGAVGGGLTQVLKGKALQMSNGGKMTHCLSLTMIVL